MAIKIRYGGALIECETPEEALVLLERFKKEQASAPRRFLAGLKDLADDTPWTGRLFWQFIDNLGDSQKQVLQLLLRKPLTDKEMRKSLRLESNQQLAGILSGISKQAAALDLSAREVYTISNELRGGESSKTYAIAPTFAEIAREMNWPEEE